MADEGEVDVLGDFEIKLEYVYFGCLLSPLCLSLLIKVFSHLEFLAKVLNIAVIPFVVKLGRTL